MRIKLSDPARLVELPTEVVNGWEVYPALL